MLPACLRLADDVFPRARAHAARRIVDAGWSQTRAAEALGLSQAMVSKHLAAPPPADPLTARLADELATEILTPATNQQQSPWCATLTQATRDPRANAALDDLLVAEALLMTTPPLALLPQVGLNIAVATPDAASPADVVAFPGRIVEVGGRLVRPAPPTFGGSGHLARVLLAMRKMAPHTALVNVRGGSVIVAKAKRLGWAIQTIERSAQDTGEECLIASLAEARRPIDAIHDPGAIGLESCLYVAGPSAEVVAQRILRLQETMSA